MSHPSIPPKPQTASLLLHTEAAVLLLWHNGGTIMPPTLQFVRFIHKHYSFHKSGIILMSAYQLHREQSTSCLCQSSATRNSFIKNHIAHFFHRSKRCDFSGLWEKSLSLSHVKFQFPSAASADYETGEVKSLVLRCRSCIKNTRSSFPGVREPCKVGWLSHFQVKMIKALGTLRTISIQPKHSIKHSEMHFPGRQYSRVMFGHVKW